jgi:DNA-binding protein HU-beta
MVNKMATESNTGGKKTLPKRPAGKYPKGGGKGMSGDALVGRVSQKTIDDIKKLGMTKALELAGKNGSTAGGLAREFQEGVRRMYGAKRLAAAKATYAPKAKPATKPVTKPAPKPKAKSGSSMSDKAKVVGGTAAAIGLLALGKGKGASAASKLSPAVGKFAKSGVGKALFGTGEKISTKAFSTAGRVTAKAGKPVSDSQYNAMKAAAKAKGIKLPAVAKATATKAKPAAKATATKPLPKLTKTKAFAASSATNQTSTTKPKTKLKTK